jgi:hypothetical protein
LLAEALGVASPVVGELEEQSTVGGVTGLFSGANAIVRLLLVQESERHGTVLP